MLETILIGLAINLCSEAISDQLKDNELEREIRKAYKRALKKWSPNTHIRDNQEYLTKERFEQLERHLLGESNEEDFDPELRRFIKLFEVEVSSSKNQSLSNFIRQEQLKYLVKTERESKLNCDRNSKKPTLKLYKAPTQYIQRSVSGDPILSDLIELVMRTRIIVLVGEAGIGKTTELEYVAYRMSNEGWYCGLIRLIDYATTLEELVNTNFKNWRYLDEKSNILIILDGLDEVDNAIVHRVENEIKQFSKKNSHVHFLISFRDSYVFLRYQAEQEGNEEDEIKRLRLNPLPIESVYSFLRGNNPRSDFLIEQMEKNDLMELCQNPFYLVNFSSIYQTLKYIPLNRSQFFESLIRSRVKREQIKGGEISELVRENELNLLQRIEELALTMQVAGTYKIANIDYQRIIKEREVRKASIRLVLIYR